MNEHPDWEELTDRHLRGELDESEKERLAERLDSNASARENFVEQVRWDTRFAEVLREKDDARHETLTSKRKPPMAFSRTLLAVAACLIMVLTAGLVFQWSSVERPIARIIVPPLMPTLVPSMRRGTGLCARPPGSDWPWPSTMPRERVHSASCVACYTISSMPW